MHSLSTDSQTTCLSFPRASDLLVAQTPQLVGDDVPKSMDSEDVVTHTSNPSTEVEKELQGLTGLCSMILPTKERNRDM